VMISHFLNLLQFGQNIPHAHELIYFNSNLVNTRIVGFKKEDSGRVIAGDWDLNQVSLFNQDFFNPTFILAYRKFELGLTWEESGLVDLRFSKLGRMGVTRAEILRDYEKLDAIEERIKNEGKFPRDPANTGKFELGGISIHIDRTGKPVFGGGGSHRLALAKFYQMERVPGKMGVIHRKVLQQQIPKSSWGK
jgi:hypothetical protein